MSGTRSDDLRRIADLAWPVFVGQIAVIGFSTIDTLLVARYAPVDLAALSVGASVYVTVFIGLMGVVLAVGPIVGQLCGAGRLEQAGRQLHQAVWIALGLSVLGCLWLVFPRPFLALAEAPAEVESRVRAYLGALAFALPAALLVQAYRGFNNAIARPKVVMALQIGALLLKIPLSLLLVFGLPAIGLPPSGVLGCAVATAIVMWLHAGAALLVLRRDPHYDRYALWRHGLTAPDRAAIRAQLRLGIPMGLSIMVEVSGFTFMAVFIARLGVTASAGHQIAANVAAMMFMMPLALGNATMTLVAQRIGAGDFDAGRRLGWRGVKLGVVLAAAMALAIALGRHRIAAWYTQDQAVLAVAVPLLAWVAAFHVADAVQAVSAFVLRACHVATAPMLIYSAALGGIGLGGGYLLAFDPLGIAPERWSGTVGYWLAATAGLWVAALALALLQRQVMRQRVPDARAAPRS